MKSSTKAQDGLSRRSFLKWSAAAATVAATTGLIGCASSGGGSSSTTTNKELQTVASIDVSEMAGEWKNASCWLDCGGNCVNQVYVEDGVIKYQRTDVSGEDTVDAPQQRGCFRGRSLRQLVFGEDRLKYPIKRKHWSPGDPHGELRGIDEWERISWDDAIELATTEIKRIVDTYGNQSILSSERSGPGPFFNAIGGSTTFWSTWSSGGCYWTSQKMVGGGWPRHALTLSDRYEYLHSKLIILWGHNPVWSSQGNPILTFLEAKRRGAKIIVIDPIYHDSAKVLADQFIGVRPGTDAAMLLGIAHYMIENNLQDQEFLDKYTVGFDSAHMPEDADPNGNFKDYVMGTYDGKPKTPEWASEICGVDAQTIKNLAMEMASTKPMALTASRAPSRTNRGDQFCQAFLTVGWMTGNVGKQGAMVGHVVTSNVGSGANGPFIMASGKTGAAEFKNSISPYVYYTINPFDSGEWSCINHSEIWEAVLSGQYHACIKGIQPIDIHLINHIGRGSTLNQSPATSKGIEAHRKVDFVVASGYHLHTNAKYSDIVFPVCTKWEEDKMSAWFYKTNRETCLLWEPITEPLFESKTDAELDELLAAPFGISKETMTPVSLKQQGWNSIQGATMLLEDMTTKVNLFSIEQDDIPEGCEGAVQEGQFAFKDFRKNGFVRVDRHDGDGYGYTALKDYIDDPVARPRETTTGKLEIYCQAITDFVDAVGYSTKSPIAEYQVPEEGYEETFSNWENKTKGAYPFQMISLHCLRTVHSSFDNVPYCREAAPNDLQLNASDAAKLGISKGDTVLVSSPYGKILRNADVTERIMPGVVKLDEATWPEIDEKTGIDKAGCANILVGDVRTGSGISAWNSCLVNVEKYTGESLEPDCDWPQRVVEV